MGARDDLDEREGRSRWLWVLLGLLALGGAIGGFVWYTSSRPRGGAMIERELRDRGRVAVIGQEDLLALEAEGAQLLPAAEVPGLGAALAETDETALNEVLQREAIAAVLVDGRPGGSTEEGATVAERLRAYARMDSLRGIYLTPTAALYERRRGLQLEPPLGEVLARAGRQIVGGARTPRLRAFPEPLRRSRNVEVMVMLERNGRPRLWRSARGSSIARALITAGSVARQRWTEREQAMGGPIDDPVRGLPRLTVRVFLLEEDGTLADRSSPFVERVFGAEHGVAFEDRGSWHYLLPRATRERGEGSAMLAYAELFDDAGVGRATDAGPEAPAEDEDRSRRVRLAAEVLQRDDLRFYRLVAREVGVSEPTSSSTGAGADVDPVPGSPSLDDLLAPLDLEAL